MSITPAADPFGKPFSWSDRPFVRAVVPSGDNKGRTFTIAQPLVGRYRIVKFFASGGMGLLLEGQDLRTGCRVLIKSILNYDVAAHARVRDREGFANQLKLPRKTLEMERRILVLLRNAGCNAVPHPNDFVFDANPLLAGPYAAEEDEEWTYDDMDMLRAEPYLVMEMVQGRSLDAMLQEAPKQRLTPARSLAIMCQVTEVLRTLHERRPMKPGMTWQLIYQDLKPANLLVSAQDRVTVIDLGGCQLINVDTGQKLLPGAATAGYCPLECEQPFNLLTPAADVYSVGVILFQMLTGRSPLEFLAADLGKNQPRAVQLDSKLLEGRCKPALRKLIERCLEPEAEKRVADVGAVQRAMQKLLAGE